MTLYLKPRAGQNAAIAICDRCKRKRHYVDLVPDGDSPGLYVCGDNAMCRDVLDPYKLPPHTTELIAVRHPRRDEDVST